MSAPNLWETIRDGLLEIAVGGETHYGTDPDYRTRDEVARLARSLLSEMKGVEAVEGGAVKDRGFSEMWDFHTDARGTERPALLLLLPEPESHE